MSMRVLEAPFVQGFLRMADDGWQQGWHEKTAEICVTVSVRKR